MTPDSRFLGTLDFKENISPTLNMEKLILMSKFLQNCLHICLILLDTYSECDPIYGNLK